MTWERASRCVRTLFCAAALLSSSAIGWQQGDTGGSPQVWGGRDVSMEMTAEGATLEFGCAHGAITQPIKPNAKGDFSVSGTYTPEHGGPVTKSNPPRDLPAVYTGIIDGESMHLEVVLTDGGQAPPPLSLTRGKIGRLVKCR